MTNRNVLALQLVIYFMLHKVVVLQLVIYFMQHKVVVPFFTNCKIMELIVITDNYCVSHM